VTLETIKGMTDDILKGLPSSLIVEEIPGIINRIYKVLNTVEVRQTAKQNDPASLDEIDWERASRLKEALGGSASIPKRPQDDLKSCNGPIALMNSLTVEFDCSSGYSCYSKDPLKGKFQIFALGTSFLPLEMDYASKQVDSILAEKGIKTCILPPKLDDALVSESQKQCLDWSMISERRKHLVVDDIRVPPRVSLNPKTAAQIGVEVIRLLEKIHKLGLVYGRSILKGLKAVVPVDEADKAEGILTFDFSTLALADWGIGSRLFVDVETRSHVHAKCRRIRAHPSKEMSPGELMEFCPSRIDDMYRLAEALMIFAGGELRGDYRGDRWMPEKRDWILDTRNLQPQGTESMYAVFNDFKNDMFKRSYELSKDKPDYEYWINKFQSIAAAIAE